MSRLLFPLLLLLLPLLGHAQDESKQKAAIVAAVNWLALTDAGKADESWKEAAPYLQNAVAKDDWAKVLQAVRKPLGSVVSRKVLSSMYTTALPGAPDGEYVVIQFQTEFAAKKSAIETVTPMLDKDGTWRVSGYLIK